MFHVARLADPSVASLSVGGQQLTIVSGHVIVPMHLVENVRRLKHVMALLSGAHRTHELAVSSVTGVAEVVPAPASPSDEGDAGDGDGAGERDAGDGDDSDEERDGNGDDSDKLV